MFWPLDVGSAVLGSDEWCPMCDQVMDLAGTHSLACMAGGHALTCHNAVRDHVYLAARRAGLNPQREERNLLPDDPRRRHRRRRDPARTAAHAAAARPLAWEGPL